MIVLNKYFLFIFLIGSILYQASKASDIQNEFEIETFSHLLNHQINIIEDFLSCEEEIDNPVEAFQLIHSTDELLGISNYFIENDHPWEALKVLMWGQLKNVASGTGSNEELKNQLVSCIDTYLLSTKQDVVQKKTSKNRKKFSRKRNRGKEEVLKSEIIILNDRYPCFEGNFNKNKILNKLNSLKRIDECKIDEGAERLNQLRQDLSLFLVGDEGGNLNILLKHQSVSSTFIEDPTKPQAPIEEITLLWASKLARFLPQPASNFYFLGVLHDDVMAKVYLLTIAAQKGHLDSQINLAEMYSNEEEAGIKQDYFKTGYYYKLASKQEGELSTLAQYNLGVFYDKGIGVEQNYETSKYYYSLAADKEYEKAYYNLGIIYEEVEKDYEKAKHYYKLAANKDVEGYIKLGSIYKKIEKDYEKAKCCFESACNNGSEEALGYLADLYYEGGYGIEQDYEQALTYYTLAADNEDARSQCNAGLMYCQGLGVEQDFKKARFYFELAAKKKYAKALFSLGRLYFYGQGVKKNYTKAKNYFELAYNYGNKNALYSIGIVCWSQQEYQKALEYFHKSAQGGQANAYVALAHLFSQGLGTEKNLVEAQDYLEKAQGLDSSLESSTLYQYIQHPNSHESESFDSSGDEESIEDSVLNTITQDDNITLDDVQPVSNTKKMSKREKKEEKHRKKIERYLQEMMLSDRCDDRSSGPFTLELEFKSDQIQNDFDSSPYGDKISELLNDIAIEPWRLRGSGKPEYLKGDMNGIMSRHITHEDRLIYKCIGALSGNTYKIKIISCDGHFY